MAVVRKPGYGLRESLRGLTHAVAVLLAVGFVRPVTLAGQIAGLPSLFGEIVDMAGDGLPGATIRLAPVGVALGGLRIALSGSDGAFAVISLEPGDYVVSISNLGFADIVDTLSLRPDADLDIFVRMSVEPVEVDPMLVEVEGRRIGPLADFDRRRRTTTGTFFTRESIEAANAVEFSDLMRTVPGMRVVPAGAFGNRLLMRGCRPDLWLDGTHVGSYSDIDTLLRPRDLEGIEIYRGSVVPGEFGTTQCGVVVAWSRRGQPEVKEANLKRQFIIAGSLVTLFVLFRR